MIIMTKEKAWGAFCDLFGATARNRVLEIFLEGTGVDNGLGNIAEESGLSRATVYYIIARLLRQGLVMPTRTVGRTQLYKLNTGNEEVKALLSGFNSALRLVENEVKRIYGEKVVVR